MKTLRGGVERTPEESIIKQQSEELEKVSCCVFMGSASVSLGSETREVELEMLIQEAGRS